MDIIPAGLDSFSDGEFTDIRRKLRLSSWWKVTGVRTTVNLPEYEDLPDSGPNTGTETWKTEILGHTYIRIEADRKRRYRCPNCGQLAPIYQMVRRRLTHLSYMGYDCVLEVDVPKLDCTCGKHRLPFPAARDKVTYTKDFEKEVLRSLLKSTITGTADRLHVGRWIVDDILSYRTRSSFDELDLSGVNMIYVDETQFSKGRNNYLTVVCDQTRRIIFMCPGKGSDTIVQFIEWLKAHGGKPQKIRIVSADMSMPYEAAVMKHLRNATLVFDRFHVVKSVQDDVDDVRRRVINFRNTNRNHLRLAHVMYTLFTHEKNMNERDAERMQNIRLNYPEVALAYDMKETFCQIYECNTREEAKEFFDQWYGWVWSCSIKEFRKRAEIFKGKLDRILSWFDNKVSNSVAECMNSMIQKTKAAACGYSNMGNFINMCMFRFGRLTIRF